MKNNKVFTRLFSGLLIGGLLLGGGSMVMAAGSDSGTANQSGTPPQMHGRMGGMHKGGPEQMQSMIDDLLANGSITQAQADAIKAKEAQLDAEHQANREAMKDMTPAERQALMEAMKADREANRQENQGERVDLFTQLVNDGVFTTAEVDTIKEAIKTNMDEQRRAELTSGLKTLVDNKTISNDQSTAIQKVMTQFAADRQAEMEATRDMTPAEKDAYRQENGKERVNPLITLVENDTITQTQADTVFKAIAQGPRGVGNHPMRGFNK